MDASVDFLDVVSAGDAHIVMEYFLLVVLQFLEAAAFRMPEVVEVYCFGEVVHLDFGAAFPVGEDYLACGGDVEVAELDAVAEHDFEVFNGYAVLSLDFFPRCYDLAGALVEGRLGNGFRKMELLERLAGLLFTMHSSALSAEADFRLGHGRLKHAGIWFTKEVDECIYGCFDVFFGHNSEVCFAALLVEEA